MQSSFFSLKNILAVLFIACLCLMLALYVQKYDNSIKWKVTSQAEIEEIPGFSFSKGPFEFGLPGHKISIVESFTAGPIERAFGTERALLILSFLGLALLLSAATYLKGFWHYLILGLFIFFFMSLDLGVVQFLGFSMFSKWSVAVLVIAFIGPAYLYNTYFKYTAFGWRILTFVGIGAVLAFFSKVDAILLQEQLAIGSYIGFSLLTIVFLLFIAEENVFGLLYLITKARGGRNNEKHFTVFGLVYLGVVGLAYAKKAGWIEAENMFFDPFILLSISSLVSLWSISHKSELYESIMSKEHAQLLILSLGVISFSFLGYNFFRGNDPYFESFHYLIIYMHLGFGVMFFLYIISNFINPLIDGFQIYKIAYKSRNLPYSTARIGGTVAVLAFFFLSDKEPLLLLQGGKYNLQGAKSEVAHEPKLATEYYRNGRVFAYDNHFSNYVLGYQNLQQSDYKEANKRFGRATLRYPSAQSFVNESGTYSLIGEVTPSLITLKKGLIEFPEEPHLLNNLGLTYLDLNEADSAQKYFAKAKSNGQLTDANKVNYWRAIDAKDIDADQLVKNFQNGNTAIKANILAKLQETNISNLALEFEMPKNAFSMHEVAYLTNAAFYFDNDSLADYLEASLSKTLNNTLSETGNHALAILALKEGNIRSAIHQLDLIQSQANKKRKGEVFNEMGLIALSEHAPILAEEFFLKAVAYGHEAAKFNQIISALELGMEQKAKSLTAQLLIQDSSLTAFYNDLLAMKKEASEKPSVLNIYYNYQEYSLAELSIMLESMDVGFARSLLDKIFLEQYENNELTQRYLALFKNRIPIESYRNTLSGKLNKQEVDQALNNPLNAPRFIAALSKLNSEEKAYNLIAEAIDINKYDILLLTEYIYRAQKLGLNDFAITGLNKLQGLASQETYAQVKTIFDQRVEESSNVW